MILSSTVVYIAQSGLKTFPRPELTENISGLEKAACVALDSEAKICQGLTEDSITGSKFIVWRGGEKVCEWESAVFLGETADYKIFQADLDADGSDEIVVANRTAVTNGMGVNYWTIAVLPFPTKTEKLDSIEFQTEDFSVAAFSPRRKGGFDIMATTWETLPIKKSGGRTALYFVGRSLIYQNGELKITERPVLVRRYLASFERERLKDLEDKAESFLWLKSKNTEKRAVEPISDLTIKSEIEGTIENVNPEKNSKGAMPAYKISLKTKTGETVSLIYSGDADESAQSVDFTGNYSQKKLYPKGYAPVNLTKGKSVKFVAYADSKKELIVRRVLWLVD